MTDETDVQDLLPAAPQDLATLRGLLFSLPAPPAPTILQARTGIIAPTSGGSGVDGNLTLQSSGDQIGAGPGGAGGNQPQTWYGESNLLDDPTFEEWGGNSSIPLALSPAVTVISPSWRGNRTLTSGTDPGIFAGQLFDRTSDPAWNPMDSAVAGVKFTATTVPYVADAYIFPVADVAFDMLGAAYLIAAVRVLVNIQGGASA